MNAKPAISAEPQQASPTYPEHARVLAGRHHFRERPDPRFSDDQWDLSAAIERPSTLQRRTARIDFSAVADPVRRLAFKEFAAARLLEPPPLAVQSRHSRPQVVTVGQECAHLLRFFRWLEIAHPASSLSQVSSDIYEAYLAYHQGRVSPIALGSYLTPLTMLYSYRGFLSGDAPTVCPFGGRSANAISGAARAPENRTPRIPEAVIAELMRWALFYVEVASDDILAARQEVFRLKAARTTKAPPVDEVARRLEVVIAKRRSEGRGLPARDINCRSGTLLAGDPERLTLSYANVNDLVGVPHQYGIQRRARLRAMLQAATKELGLEMGGLDTPRARHPDTDRPWRPGWNCHEVLRHESVMLSTACFIVIAYLSGMREDEIQRLQRGCHSVARAAGGAIVRHKLRGEIAKGRHGVPEQESWVVVAPVQRAVAVMEQITPDEFLFSVEVAGRTEKPSQIETRERLLRFVNHVNLVAKFNALPAIPEHDGRSWALSPRQFRRTLAFFIARQPFGVVAGKLQYKHLSVATFEGYAGSSRAGFREEVEEERVMASLDDFVDIYEAIKAGERIAGPGGRRLTNACLHIREEIGDFPGVVVDDKRLRAMLLHVARDLHPGVLNHCWFDPAKALCRRGADAKNGPILNHCQPALCANSCVAPSDLPRWDEAISDARAMRRQRGLSTLQQSAIDTQITIMQSVHDGTPS